MMNPDMKNKKNLIIAGALVLCVVVAAVVYLGLKTVVPKDNDLLADELIDANSPVSKEQAVKKADVAFKAGEDALKVGKTDEAITHLTDAKKFYEQAGETAKVEQTSDTLSIAEHDAKIEDEQPPQEQSGGEGPEGQSSDDPEDVGGEEPGSGDGSEEPTGSTPTGDKATRES